MSSHYENDVPVSDEWTILDLLYTRWGDRTTRRLSRWPHAPNYVEVEDGGEHVAHYRRYLVHPDRVALLLATGLLEGKKEWGYTELRELYVSSVGAVALHDKWKELDALYGLPVGPYGCGGVPPAAEWLRRQLVAEKPG